MKVNVNIPIIVNIVNIYYEVQGCVLIPGIGGENLQDTQWFPVDVPLNQSIDALVVHIIYICMYKMLCNVV
jgi:hypothetical protein